MILASSDYNLDGGLAFAVTPLRLLFVLLFVIITWHFRLQAGLRAHQPIDFVTTLQLLNGVDSFYTKSSA